MSLDPKLLDRSSRRITCILPRGDAATRLLEGLRHTQGILATYVRSARGTDVGSEGRAPVEKDIVSVVVPAGRTDEVFRYLYDQAEIWRPGRGLMFQTKLDASTVYRLPEAPDEA